MGLGLSTRIGISLMPWEEPTVTFEEVEGQYSFGVCKSGYAIPRSVCMSWSYHTLLT